MKSWKFADQAFGIRYLTVNTLIPTLNFIINYEKRNLYLLKKHFKKIRNYRFFKIYIINYRFLKALVLIINF